MRSASPPGTTVWTTAAADLGAHAPSQVAEDDDVVSDDVPNGDAEVVDALRDRAGDPAGLLEGLPDLGTWGPSTNPKPPWRRLTSDTGRDIFLPGRRGIGSHCASARGKLRSTAFSRTAPCGGEKE